MTQVSPTPEQCLKDIFQRGRESSWRGWDPYDALSSPLVRVLTFGLPWMRTAWIQLFKRLPLNLRPLAMVPKLQNPKALALFASAAWEISPFWGEEMERVGRDLLDRLERLAVRRDETMAWGYPFDWQSRAFFAPRNTPNAIVTSFCGHAFLDGFETIREEQYLADAVGACQFILRSLHQTSRGNSLCFSYTPNDRSQIHNANLLAASLLDRTAEITGRNDFRQAAERAVRFTLAAQHTDGSWPYGEAPNQQWIDGFHTGFNLMALHAMSQGLWRDWLKAPLGAGYAYYKNTFFLEDGTPRYFSNKTYPVDIHSAAVAVLACHTLSNEFPDARPLARKVLSWTLARLWDPRQCGFIYQKRRFYDVRIPYLRWADAWMAHALSTHIAAESLAAKELHGPHLSSRLSY